MDSAKITISISHILLQSLDNLVNNRIFLSRNEAIQRALQEKIARIQKNRLALECAKLNTDEEQALADVGLTDESEQWPPY